MWERSPSARQRFKCSAGFSFYHDLISVCWAGGPNEVGSGTLHRICTLARKMGVHSVLIEDALDRPDILTEINSLEAVAPEQGGVVHAVAITFLYAPARGARRRAGETFADRILGQALVITYPMADQAHSYVFEAVLRIPHLPGAGRMPLLNNHISMTCDMEVEVAGERASIRGTYFCQQNGSTTVCAHSTLRSVHRCNGVGVSIGSAALNVLLGSEQAPKDATDVQLGAAFGKLGYRLHSHEFKSAAHGRADDAAWGVMCSLVESGLPALLLLSLPGKTGHVVPVIGHTLNSDEWHPVASQLYGNLAPAIISSSAWVDHLIIHDDLFGPYYCLARAALLEGGSAASGPLPRMVIGLLPLDVEISAHQAQQFGKEALDRLLPELASEDLGKGIWWKYLAEPHRQKVVRTTLVSRPSYVAHIRKMFDNFPTNEDLALFLEALPERFWMCEISLPQLFAGNRTKLGEVLLRIAGNPGDWQECLLGLRLPSLLMWVDGQNFAVADAGVNSHYPILDSTQHSAGW